MLRTARALCIVVGMETETMTTPTRYCCHPLSCSDCGRTGEPCGRSIAGTPGHERCTGRETETPPVKYGDQLEVGDVIRVMGHDHTITALPAYPNPHLFEFMDERWRVARSGRFGMTIDPDHLWARRPDGAWINADHYAPGRRVSFGATLRRARPEVTK